MEQPCSSLQDATSIVSLFIKDPAVFKIGLGSQVVLLWRVDFAVVAVIGARVLKQGETAETVVGLAEAAERISVLQSWRRTASGGIRSAQNTTADSFACLLSLLTHYLTCHVWAYVVLSCRLLLRILILYPRGRFDKGLEIKTFQCVDQGSI